MDKMNGHDKTPAAAAVDQLAAEQLQRAAQAAYQAKAMPMMLQQVTAQRNSVLDQLALAQAELAMLRADYQTSGQQYEAIVKELAAARTDLDAAKAELERIQSQLDEVVIAAAAEPGGEQDTAP